MPNVPYNPVPGIRDLGRPIYPGTGAGPIHVDTPKFTPEMFGAQVGAALSHFGTVSEQTGKELFARAEAFQKLDNSNDANMAALDANKAQDDLYEQYKQNEGKNAVEAWKTLPDQMEDTRQQFRARLKNDDARREFDILTRQNTNRLNAQGAGYSASQHKVWTDATNKATIGNTMRNVTLTPENIPHLDDMKKQLYDQNSAYLGGQVGTDGKGWDDKAIEEDNHKKWSDALGGAVEDLARDDPTTAERILNERRQSGEVENDSYGHAMEVIKVRKRDVMSRGIVQNMMNGSDHRLGEGKVSLERLRNAIGGIESSNNYFIPNQYSGSARCGEVIGRYQVCENYLPDYLKQAGMPPMTKEEFHNNPAAQDQLFEKNIMRLQDQGGSANEAASRWFTGRSIADAMAHQAHDKFNTTVPAYLTKLNASLAATSGPREFDAAAQDLGLKLNPQDALFPQYLEAKVKTQLAVNNQHQREAQQDAVHTIQEAASTPKQDGQLVGDTDELLADPARRRAWMQMPEPARQAVLDRLNANATKGYINTPAKEQKFIEVMGMLRTVEGRRNFEDNVDLPSLKLTNPQTVAIIKRWRENKSNANDDPSVNKIKAAYPDIMDSVGIKRQPGHEDEKYWRFVEEAQGAWDSYREMHDGKSPDKAAIDRIGAGLGRKIVHPGFMGSESGWLGATTTYAYRDIPKEDIATITRDLTAKMNGTPPNMRQVEREFAHRAWNEIWQSEKPREAKGPTAKEVAAEEAKAPQVPVSR